MVIVLFNLQQSIVTSRSVAGYIIHIFPGHFFPYRFWVGRQIVRKPLMDLFIVGGNVQEAKFPGF
ncbi:hypothetical protein [Leptospirillum ferrooxidans]|jgi:hypothetical protein|uniref:hypothetical protein n=1 Tax=Leptospirillum ferrooxidans TaxID=180 RepID=UPI000303261D|nr:hypothetical protein [Leptospirillum ferrooxidans]